MWRVVVENVMEMLDMSKKCVVMVCIYKSIVSVSRNVSEVQKGWEREVLYKSCVVLRCYTVLGW